MRVGWIRVSSVVFALAILLVGSSFRSARSACFTPVPPSINDAHVWLDTNGDGLPGPNQLVLPNSMVSVDIWFDTGDFEWTAFQAWLRFGTELGNLCFSRDTSEVEIVYHVPIGLPFPPDNFSSPYGFGIAGSDVPPTSGVTRIATVTTRILRSSPDFSCCMSPIVDPDDPYYVFCVVQRYQPSAYGLFCAGTVDSVCYGTISTANEQASWGRVKGLFR